MGKKNWIQLEKRAVLVLLALLLLLVPRRSAGAAEQGTVYLSEKKLAMVQCEYYRLKLRGTSSKIKWQTSNPDVATVSSSGRVHAVGKGKCRITALSQGEKYTCTVKVKALKLSKSSLNIVRGRQAVLALNSRFAKKVKWSSSNPKVAVMEKGGIVHAVGIGTCEIQAMWRDAVLSCAVNVLPINPDSLQLSYAQKEENYGKIVLAGSSSMDLWYSAPQAFAPYEVINMAISGTRTVQWLEWHENMIVQYKPSAVVLYVGANDLGSGNLISGEENAANTIALLKSLRSRLKKTPIFYIGVCPCYLREGAWEVIKTSNALVKQYCESKSYLYYLDLPSAVTGADGKPNPDFFLSDRLHPNPNGYLVWKKVVGNAVKKEMKRLSKTKKKK